MAKEGETSAIPTIVLIMYGFISFLSFLTTTYAGDPWWTIPIYYVQFMIAFYYWHVLAHSKWTGRMYELHM